MLWLLALPVLAVTFWVIVQLALFLHQKRRNEIFFAACYRLRTAVETAVKELQQTTENYKFARVDRKLRGDTSKELRATALKIIQSNLGPRGLTELRGALGLSRKAPLDRVLVSHIEAAVYDLKAPPEPEPEVPSSSSRKFIPDTMRLPRIDKPSAEDDPETLFDENTQVTRRP